MKKRITIDEILFLLKENNIKICIFDFDYTLTRLESNSSIGVFNNKINPNYRRKKHILDIITKYLKTKKMYKIIWKNKLKLLSKYNYKKYLHDIEITKNFIPNEKMLSLIKKAIKLNIDVIIYSSGLKCIIEMFLNQNMIDKEKIKIIANEPEDIKNIVTPFKNKLNLKDKCVCFGDKREDLKLVKNSINILVDNDSFYIE